MFVGLLVIALLALGPNTVPAAERAGSGQRHLTSLRKHQKGTQPQRRVAAEADGARRRGRDYWEKLVGTPSRLAQSVVKQGVLPSEKYSMATFDIEPFQAWLRQYSLLPQTNSAALDIVHLAADQNAPASSPPRRAIPAPPLSFICGVWYSPLYKFIFVRNRKTASSTFLTAVKKFMIENNLCNSTKTPGASHPNNCIMRMEPQQLGSEGINVDDIWREYLVITSTRNPWARAASGYQFTFDKWQRTDGGCAQPTFDQFCRDPYIMGKLSNLFNCVTQREGVGSRHEGHWNFDFCHVEPAALCMLDDAGKLVVDFVIRYERLDEDMQSAMELINARRPPGVPAIEIPETVKWRNKGTTAKNYDINSTDEAAFVYADKYRQCGMPCVDALADFYSTDLELFGWERPGPPPVTLPPPSSPPNEEEDRGDAEGDAAPPQRPRKKRRKANGGNPR